jgi:hypothetical protein
MDGKGVKKCNDITAAREDRLFAIFPAAPRKPLRVGHALGLPAQYKHWFGSSIAVL